MAARWIHDGVWMVGSGTDTVALTDPHDCHSYLVQDGDGNGLVVDAGTGLGAEQWVQNISEVCEPSRIVAVVLTHYHADHAGATHIAIARGMEVYGSRPTALAIMRGDETRTQLKRAREVGLYPSSYNLMPAGPVIAIRDGQLVRAGLIRIRALAAPGHCDGHMVYLLDLGDAVILFAGDAFFAGGRVSIQPIPDCRVDRYAATATRLGKLPVDIMLSGHGEAVVANAQRDLLVAAECFDRFTLPPNLQAGTHRGRQS